MTITIDLPEEVEGKIKARALDNGLQIEAYVEQLIKEAFERREWIEKESEKTFAEILAPIHKGFEESGMSEDEILEMFEKAREEVWQEKQKSK